MKKTNIEAFLYIYMQFTFRKGGSATSCVYAGRDKHHILTRSVRFGHGHVHDPADILRFGRRSGKAADARLGRCARGQAVGVVVGPCCHLFR